MKENVLFFENMIATYNHASFCIRAYMRNKTTFVKSFKF